MRHGDERRGERESSDTGGREDNEKSAEFTSPSKASIHLLLPRHPQCLSLPKSLYIVQISLALTLPFSRLNFVIPVAKI